jgi:IS5 family transposase
VDVDWLIAERPGKGRTLKQHPAKNKTAHQGVGSG